MKLKNFQAITFSGLVCFMGFGIDAQQVKVEEIWKGNKQFYFHYGNRYPKETHILNLKNIKLFQEPEISSKFISDIPSGSISVALGLAYVHVFEASKKKEIGTETWYQVDFNGSKGYIKSETTYGLMDDIIHGTKVNLEKDKVTYQKMLDFNTEIAMYKGYECQTLEVFMNMDLVVTIQKGAHESIPAKYIEKFPKYKRLGNGIWEVGNNTTTLILTRKEKILEFKVVKDTKGIFSKLENKYWTDTNFGKCY